MVGANELGEVLARPCGVDLSPIASIILGGWMEVKDKGVCLRA